MRIIGVMTTRTQSAVALIAWSELTQRLTSHITMLELSGPLADREIETASYGRAFLSDCITELTVRGVTTPVSFEEAPLLRIAKYLPSSDTIHLGTSDVLRSQRHRLCMTGSLSEMRRAFPGATLTPWAKHYATFIATLADHPPTRSLYLRGVPLLEF